MPNLQYAVAVDPLCGGRWLVLEQSTDFEGWVVLMACGHRQDAERFIDGLLDAQERLRVELANVGEAAHDEQANGPPGPD